MTSATLFYFGTGLRPMPWCMWLAPLPVLVLAPRVSARTAFTAAYAAWLGGETVMWGYFLDTLRIPAVLDRSVRITYTPRRHDEPPARIKRRDPGVTAGASPCLRPGRTGLPAPR